MSWTIIEDELRVRDADALSALFTVGNGRFCARGVWAEERSADFRGTYFSGLYTRAPYGLIYFMAGPDWPAACLRAYTHRQASAHSDGRALRCVASRRELDLRRGVLSRAARFEGPGAKVEVVEERWASLAHPNLAAQRFTLRRLAASERGVLEFVLGLDGDVRNHRAKYYRPGQFPNCDARGLRLSTLETCAATAERAEVVLAARASGHRAAAVAWLNAPARCEVRPLVRDGLAAWVCRLPEGLSADEALVFEKLCILTADLKDWEDAREDAERLYAQHRRSSYADLRGAHEAAWARFWDEADVEIEGDARAQRAVRFALWSTRIAAPLDDGGSSLGAKNLTGDWYRGAVFWDMEMFQLPLLAAVRPELARNHLRYRRRRLPAARVLAAQDGYSGARFPWQSYASGLEEPPVAGGFLYQQQHLNAAVGWGVLHHHYLAEDRAFLLDCGFELLLELCKFWASRAEGPDEKGRWHVRNVCGPDELHQGIDDNAYTNRMAANLLAETVRLAGEFLRADADTAARLRELLARLQVGENDFARWRELAAALHVPLLEGGAPAQFEGFAEHPEPDERLNSSNPKVRDKTNKQADALLLFQALPDAFPDELLGRAFREYAPLCHQTSSLSLCTHALLAARLRRERDAERFFRAAAGVDLEDQLGNTAHGIHAAGEGGVWLAAVHGFGGLSVGAAGVSVSPLLPPFWTRLRYRFQLRGQPLEVDAARDGFRIVNRGSAPARLAAAGTPAEIPPGGERSFAYRVRWEPPRLEGVIFDLDGVLVTTDRFHFQAWKELAEELGLAFDEQVNHRLRGVSREESLRTIYAHNRRAPPAEAEFAALCERKNARFRELVAAMTERDALPGARELLAALRQAGVRLAVASASRNARSVLERTGLAKLVDALADGNLLTASKPDPQVFYLAAQRLRCLPWNCVGLEDAPAGIEALHRAGMPAVGIGPAVRAAGADEAEDLAAADWVAPGVKEVTAESLLRLFAGKQNRRDPYYERNVAKMKSEMS